MRRIMDQLVIFTSAHFSIHRLSDGVYAALHTEGGAAIGNAGLIDLGGLVLVFDTFLTPQAASDLRQFALEAGHPAPQFVINSHYHNDHMWGNQVFAREASIVSSATTLALMDTLGAEDYQWYAEHAPQRFIEIQAASQGHSQDDSLLGMLGYYGGLVAALPTLAVTKPTITFEGRLNFFGHERQAELIEFKGAHTGSDTVLYLPQDRILFMGDVLFVESHPYLCEGNPEMLLDTLHQLIEFDADIFVPGHGPIGGKQHLQAMLDYVEDCLGLANELIDSCADPDKIAIIDIPHKYAGWQCPQFFQGNLKSIYERKKDIQQR